MRYVYEVRTATGRIVFINPANGRLSNKMLDSINGTVIKRLEVPHEVLHGLVGEERWTRACERYKVYDEGEFNDKINLPSLTIKVND